MIKYFTAGLLLSLFGITFAKWTIWPREDTLHYWDERSFTLRLQPCGAKIEIMTSSDVFLTRVDSTNTFSVFLGRPNVTVLTDEGKLIDLLQCEGQKSLVDSLSRPYLALFDNVGTMKDIYVDGDENNLAINLKRLIVKHYHLNIPQLEGKLPPVLVKRVPSDVGVCPSKREVLKLEDGRDKVKILVGFSTCKRVREDNRSDKLTCLGQTCGSLEDRNLTWFGADDVWVRKVDGRYVIEKMEMSQWGRFNPHKKSKQEISWVLKVQTELLSKRKMNVPLFRTATPVVVKDLRIPKINQGICESKQSNVLTNMYAAAVCEQEFSFMYEDIIAKAIECSKIK